MEQFAAAMKLILVVVVIFVLFLAGMQVFFPEFMDAILDKIMGVINGTSTTPPTPSGN